MLRPCDSSQSSTGFAAIICDNCAQFIAKDFKEYISLTGEDRIGLPESNGKKERFYRTIKSECLRSIPLLSRDDAHSVVGRFIEHYNEHRLHSAIGYITPADKLAGRAETDFWGQAYEHRLIDQQDRPANCWSSRVHFAYHRRLQNVVQRLWARPEADESTLNRFPILRR